jgi:hypothetical protein
MVLPARKITRPRVLCSNFKLNAMNNTAFMKKLWPVYPGHKSDGFMMMTLDIFGFPLNSV